MSAHPQKSRKKPGAEALIADDDPMQIRALGLMLKKLGLDSETADSSKAFLAKLRARKPSLCLIDLNMESLGSGFELVEAARSQLGPAAAIFIVSAVSDQSAIAHGLEVGASDFIVKPVDETVLSAKVSMFLKRSGSLESEMSPLPDGPAEASVGIELEVQEIDELGVKLVGRHLLSKGTAMEVDSAILRECSGSQGPVTLKVTGTWVEPGAQLYGASAEFNPADSAMVARVRSWLARR